MERHRDGYDALRFVLAYAAERNRRGRELDEDEQEELIEQEAPGARRIDR